MDIWYMLLGRSLQVFRYVVHVGHMSSYTLTKDGVKHKLKSLKDEEESVCSFSRVSFVDRKKFLEGMSCEDMFFSIIP